MYDGERISGYLVATGAERVGIVGIPKTLTLLSSPDSVVFGSSIDYSKKKRQKNSHPSYMES